MAKIVEVLKIIAPYLGEYVSTATAIEVAEKIEAIYVFDPEAWVESHKDEYEGRKIQCIKDLRQAALDHGMVLGLKEAKDVVVAAMPWKDTRTQPALDALREKLNAPSPLDNYCSDPDCCDPRHGEDEDRAYAEYRERMAENGTWFGVPGPLDEEPF
jgi:ribosomal protein L7/L12